MICPLCHSTTISEYHKDNSILYLLCDRCCLVFKHPDHFPTIELEKERYLLHNNDVNDERYQRFVAPIVEVIMRRRPVHSKGLDFGAGTGPVIAKLLKDNNYSMMLYDPYFHPDKSVLSLKYDFIVCCEVIEHFHNPLKEFKLMKKLLNSGGILVCMTELLPKKDKFEKWYYKNDSTHVAFYAKQSLQWIKEHLGFAEVRIQGRLIVFDT